MTKTEIVSITRVIGTKGSQGLGSRWESTITQRLLSWYPKPLRVLTWFPIVWKQPLWTLQFFVSKDFPGGTVGLVLRKETKFCGSPEEKRIDMGVLEKTRGVYQMTKVDEGIKDSKYTSAKAQRPSVTCGVCLLWCTWSGGIYWILILVLWFTKCHVEYQRNEKDTSCVRLISLESMSHYIIKEK